MIIHVHELTQWPLSSRVLILLAYTKQHSVLSCSTLILRILQLLQYAGMSSDSACDIPHVPSIHSERRLHDIYRRPWQHMC